MRAAASAACSSTRDVVGQRVRLSHGRAPACQARRARRQPDRAPQPRRLVGRVRPRAPAAGVERVRVLGRGQGALRGPVQRVGPLLELVAQRPLGQPQRVPAVLVDGEQHLVEVTPRGGLGQLAQVLQLPAALQLPEPRARALRPVRARRAPGTGSRPAAPRGGSRRRAGPTARRPRRGRPVPPTSTDWSPGVGVAGRRRSGPARPSARPARSPPRRRRGRSRAATSAAIFSAPRLMRSYVVTIAAATSRRSHASTSGHVSRGSPRSMTSSTRSATSRIRPRRSCSMSDTRSATRSPSICCQVAVGAASCSARRVDSARRATTRSASCGRATDGTLRRDLAAQLRDGEFALERGSAGGTGARGPHDVGREPGDQRAEAGLRHGLVVLLGLQPQVGRHREHRQPQPGSFEVPVVELDDPAPVLVQVGLRHDAGGRRAAFERHPQELELRRRELLRRVGDEHEPLAEIEGARG